MYVSFNNQQFLVVNESMTITSHGLIRNLELLIIKRNMYEVVQLLSPILYRKKCNNSKIS